MFAISRVPISPKRKRQEEENTLPESLRRESRSKALKQKDPKRYILQLEEAILRSRKNYNNIATLINIVKKGNLEDEKNVLPAAFSLCHVFEQLIPCKTAGPHDDNLPENEQVIAQWLRSKHNEFVAWLLDKLAGQSSKSQLTALQLLMLVMKQDGNYMYLRGIVEILLTIEHGQESRDYLVREYVEKDDNIRYRTFSILRDIASKLEGEETPENLASNMLSILSQIETRPQSSTAHKLKAQGAWLALLRLDLTDDLRKTVLRLMSDRIAPWFVKVELLMDFLTDSYNIGGSMSHLALSGLFYLIQKKNLDYPQFYPKLYSLLDGTILHSRHRSRFFRLLDTFLSSTHLPAALVASFIKRLSRLTLYAPPAGIIIVIPWIYNLLKKHPTCTFMIHRETLGEDRKLLEEEGMDDPFDEKESDPMQTNAIESSLWEIQMLQSHYHPNVATLAKIISEQFTKHAYNLEDFLDHSYSSMLDTELSREIKKAPVVEYEIPKRIFAGREGIRAEEETLLEKLWEFS